MNSANPSDFTRREFIGRSIVLACTAFGAISPALASSLSSFAGDDVFQRILGKAKSEKWKSLPIGELMGKIAKELEGTPYVGGILDHSVDVEKCTIDMKALDCVTFFETTLCFARMLKKGGHSPDDLLREVRLTRYRGGKMGDYTSRLHYTTDWFVDNPEKGVIKILADLPGAEPFTQKVGFMSSRPELYKPLAAHPELVPKIREYETAINARHLVYIPAAKVADVEPLLKSGDIVGMCTAQSGIDIAHTGLIYRDSENVAHFMDASSGKSKMKVTIEQGPISQSIASNKSWTGAMFARPLEP